jgi:hypothetical protein
MGTRPRIFWEIWSESKSIVPWPCPLSDWEWGGPMGLCLIRQPIILLKDSQMFARSVLAMKAAERPDDSEPDFNFCAPTKREVVWLKN